METRAWSLHMMWCSKPEIAAWNATLTMAQVLVLEESGFVVFEEKE